MTQREMQDRLQVRSASLSELLHKLERAGLVERVRDESDKRSVVLSPTPEGRRLYEEHAGARRERAEAMFAALDETERKDLAALLTKLVAAWRPDDSDESGEEAEGRCGCRGHGHGHGHGRHGCMGRHGRHHGHGRRHGGRGVEGEGESFDDEPEAASRETAE